MSGNRIDLSLYMRVALRPGDHQGALGRVRRIDPAWVHTDKSLLSYLFEEFHQNDSTWPYQIEAQAPEGELWISHTLLSANYDDFDAVWVNDVDSEAEFHVAQRWLTDHRITVLERRVGLVCWYDAADRPFPKKMVQDATRTA